MNPADDPDVHYLINLLAMLPGRNDVAFWNTIDTNGAARSDFHAPADTKPTGDGYLLKKMEIGIRNLLSEPVGDIAYFCEYLLKFFDGDRPTLWYFLNAHVAASGFTDQAGERWTRDLCDTAWRITVRYNRRGRDELAAQWPRQ